MFTDTRETAYMENYGRGVERNVPKCNNHEFPATLYEDGCNPFAVVIHVRWNGVRYTHDDCRIESMTAIRLDGMEVTSGYEDQIKEEVVAWIGGVA